MAKIIHKLKSSKNGVMVSECVSESGARTLTPNWVSVTCPACLAKRDGFKSVAVPGISMPNLKDLMGKRP